MPEPIFSVVLCTYNRADLLRNVLRTLTEQTLNAKDFEVVVVDNNSTDQTRSVAEEFTAKHPNFRYCIEYRQGVSHARNRGLLEAHADYIAYTDDDCEIPPQWLSIAMEIIQKFQPTAFGGPYSAFYNTQKPKWFKDAYESRDFGLEPRPLNGTEHLIGCNIFFRRSVVNALGGFNVDLGMAGKKIAYGEEAAIQMLIRSTHPESLIYYDPRLLVYHLVRAEQMTFSWVVRKFFAKGRYIHSRNERKDDRLYPARSILFVALKTVGAMIVDLAFAIVKRDRKRYRYIQNYFYERSTRYLARLGRIFEGYKKQVHRKASGIAAAESD